jgi:hypothetical protein
LDGLCKIRNKMSWSVTTKGTSEEVVKHLEGQSEILDGQSKEEFDSALPHIIALVKENVPGIVNLTAYGHGVKDSSGNYVERNCSVNITR